VHDCGRERAVGYFVELLILIAPFAKKVRCLNTCVIHALDGILGCEPISDGICSPTMHVKTLRCSSHGAVHDKGSLHSLYSHVSARSNERYYACARLTR
jgi:hypothetical protein